MAVKVLILFFMETYTFYMNQQIPTFSKEGVSLECVSDWEVFCQGMYAKYFSCQELPLRLFWARWHHFILAFPKITKKMYRNAEYKEFCDHLYTCTPTRIPECIFLTCIFETVLLNMFFSKCMRLLHHLSFAS